MGKITRAPKVTAAQENAFICKLFDPLPDAELADPAMKRLEDKARREARERQCAEWHDGWLRVEEATLYYRSLDLRRFRHEMYGTTEVPLKQDLDAAWGAVVREVERQMQIPAADPSQLRWKKKHETVGGWGFPPNAADRAAAIAADEARLSKSA